MDRVTTVKSQIKLRHWAQLIEKCQSSSLTVKEWCSSNNISKDQYYYWLGKLREHTVENLPIEMPNDMDVQKADVSFGQLQVNVPACTSKAAVTIHMANLRGSKLSEAVIYAMNQKPYMENYLLDGRCSISNNLAENAIRPFATGRKNWLFADTPKGADASARVYSIVETAKANGLDVFKYLEELLQNMPMWDHTEEYLERMMPWSDYMQDLCKS